MKIDISQSPGVLDALNAVLNKGSVAELKIEHGRIVVIEIKGNEASLRHNKRVKTQNVCL